MKLKNIIIILFALSPFHFTLAMDYTNNKIQGRPAPKKYIRRIPKSPQIEEPLYESLEADGFIEMEEKFKRAFGYSIPENYPCYKQTNFITFIADNNLLNTIQTPSTQNLSAQEIKSITEAALQFLAQKKIDEKKALLERKIAVEQEIRDLEIENKRLEKEAILIKETNRKNSERELEEKKMRIIEANKKEAIAKQKNKDQKKKQIWQNKQNNTDSQKPEKSISSQKAAIKRMLMSKNNCQTERALKINLAHYCSSQPYPLTCFFDRTSPTSGFHYVHKINGKVVNELKILIGDELYSPYCGDCQEANDSSSQ